MNNPTIDCTGRRWFPHEGDLVRDTDSGRYDLAAGQREQARTLRLWAEALRVVESCG